MSTTLEQRQAVGTEAAPKVVRKPGRGPIWPFIVGGLALLAVVVAGITFAVSEPAPTQIREGAPADGRSTCRRVSSSAASAAGLPASWTD